MRKEWVAGAAIAIILIAGLFPFLHKGTGGTSELPVYTIAADRMLAGEEIYRTSDAKPFTYPPFFALPFLPFPEIPLDPPRDAAPFVAWYLLNIAALMTILIWIHRRLLVDSETDIRPWAFWLITMVIAGRYLGSVLGNQSHDMLVLLPVVLAIEFLLRQRDRTAGVFAALAAASKATPLLLVIMLVLQRRWQAVLAMAITGIVVTLIPDLLMPRNDGDLWVLAWLKTFVLKLNAAGPADTGPWVAGNILNQSLGGTLHRLVGDSPAIVIAQLLILALVTASVAVRHRGSAITMITQAGAVVCGMVLLSPMSSKAHFCVLVIPVAICTYHALSAREPVAIATLAFAFVSGTLTSKDVLGRELGNQVLAWGSVTWISVALLLAMTWFCWHEHMHKKAQET